MIPPAVWWMRSKLIGTTGNRSRAAEPILQSRAFVVRLSYLLEARKLLSVVLVAGAYDVTGLLSPVDLSDLGCGRGCAGRALVGKKVVLEPIHNRRGDICDIAPAAEC